jgi:hypothetical protein
VLRPGEDPIRHLASAIAAPDVLGLADEDFVDTNRVLMDATLRRGGLGLAEAVRQARIPKDHNLLVLVDQFEELFRFRSNSQIAHSRDEAIAFVRLLLEASRQHELPIYVVLTMRSDFIGDCMDFPGLSDAVNDGLYLVGRMSRDALRSAITGPVSVGGGTIAPRLVHRVLNDLGDDHDQLPLVQHALMRTWDHWERTHAEGAPLDVADYEAAGTFRRALSMHAEEAYQEAVAAGFEAVAQHMFKALTDTVSDARGVRRPTSVAELAAVAAVPESDILRVVDIFRQPGRSFLMPPQKMALTSTAIIDVSHESLMRCWERLIAWAADERASAEFYMRLSRAAAWFEEGSAGLWRNPELELARRWRRDNPPTAAWSLRYDAHFNRAMTFLERSLDARRQFEAREAHERRAKLRRVQWTAGILATLLVVTAALAVVAWRESARAEGNLELARGAVDESLSSVDRDPARVAADVPQVEAIRRDLLAKAETFYVAFMKQAPNSEKSRRDLANSHFRLGHINRMLAKPDEAAKEYQDAIARFTSLAAEFPANPDYRAALANADNWLGETFRPIAARYADAERAYESASALQQTLALGAPANPQYRSELARTLYNRGILRGDRPDADATALAAADRDFREAARLIEPLAATDPRAAQELARVYNNLGSLLTLEDDARHADEVRQLWEKAIALDERLVAAAPDNREYKLELATFCSNLASMLNDRGAVADAERRSLEALGLIEDLSHLPPSLAIARADAHALHGLISQALDAARAEVEYARALELFAEGRSDPAIRSQPAFYQRFGDFIVDLAAFPQGTRQAEQGRQLLSRAVGVYAEVAADVVRTGAAGDAALASEQIPRILPVLPERDRAILVASRTALQRVIGVQSPR